MVLDRLASFVKNLGQTPTDDGSWWPVPAVRAAVTSDVERASRERTGGDPLARYTVELNTPGRVGQAGCGIALLVPAVVAGVAATAGRLGQLPINVSPPWLVPAAAGLLGLGALYFFLGLLTPKLRVLADRSTFDPAQPHTLAWSFGGPPRGVRRVRVRLAGQERATYRRGSDTTTDTHAFYKEVLLDTREAQRPVVAEGTFGFTLPPGVMHSFRSNNNEIRWTLEVKAWVALMPDIRHNIVLTVWPGDDPRGYYADPASPANPDSRDSYGAPA